MEHGTSPEVSEETPQLFQNLEVLHNIPPSNFLTILHAFFSSPMQSICPAFHILIDLQTILILNYSTNQVSHYACSSIASSMQCQYSPTCPFHYQHNASQFYNTMELIL